MKFNLTKGIVTLTSETPEEAIELFVIATKPEKKVPEPKTRKKRHLHSKVCDICGVQFRGAQGLGVHKRFTHKIKSPSAEVNAKWYETHKEKENAERSFTGIWK